MARWITQTYKVNDDAEIEVGAGEVWVGHPTHPAGAIFKPKDLADAMAMSIALRAAAKRLEEIGKAIR